MNRLDKKEIWNYCESVSSAEPDYLKALTRETNLKTLAPQMLSESIMGRMLAFVSRMIQPEQILELGTFTGYGTLCLAEGLPADGRLDTIERNPEHENMVNTYFAKSIYNTQLHLHIGDAFEIIPSLNLTYDLIYLDGAKKHYCEFYDLVFPKLQLGGTLIADNVLWYGNILDKKKNTATASIDAFNKKVYADDRVENLILPLRDGLQLIQKIKA